MVDILLHLPDELKREVAKHHSKYDVDINVMSCEKYFCIKNFNDHTVCYSAILNECYCECVSDCTYELNFDHDEDCRMVECEKSIIICGKNICGRVVNIPRFADWLNDQPRFQGGKHEISI